jgi:hypothetical protein
MGRYVGAKELITKVHQLDNFGSTKLDPYSDEGQGTHIAKLHNYLRNVYRFDQMLIAAKIVLSEHGEETADIFVAHPANYQSLATYADKKWTLFAYNPDHMKEDTYYNQFKRNKNNNGQHSDFSGHDERKNDFPNEIKRYESYLTEKLRIIKQEPGPNGEMKPPIVQHNINNGDLVSRLQDQFVEFRIDEVDIYSKEVVKLLVFTILENVIEVTKSKN